MTALDELRENLKATMPPELWDEAMKLFQQDLDAADREARERFDKGERIDLQSLAGSEPTVGIPRLKRIKTFV